MRDEVKKIQVRIGNMVYQLSATEDPNYIQEIASIADELITKIARRYPHMNSTSTQVLALVNAVDAMRQAQADLQQAIMTKDNAVQNEIELKAELARLREQFWELKKELLYYKNLCDIHEQRLAELTSAPENRIRQIRPRRTMIAKDHSLAERQTSIDDLKEYPAEKN